MLLKFVSFLKTPKSYKKIHIEKRIVLFDLWPNRCLLFCHHLFEIIIPRRSVSIHIQDRHTPSIEIPINILMAPMRAISLYLVHSTSSSPYTLSSATLLNCLCLTLWSLTWNRLLGLLYLAIDFVLTKRLLDKLVPATSSVFGATGISKLQLR